MKNLRAIGIIVFVLVVIIVVVQNHQAMSTNVKFKADFFLFSFETGKMSVYLVTVIAFLVGVVFSGLYGMVERFRLKKRVKVLLRQIKEKDNELNSLRNLPVTAEDVGPDQSFERE